MALFTFPGAVVVMIVACSLLPSSGIWGSCRHLVSGRNASGIPRTLHETSLMPCPQNARLSLHYRRHFVCLLNWESQLSVWPVEIVF